MPDPDPTGNPIGAILLILVFFLLSLLLAVGEEAISTVGISRFRELEEDGDHRAARIRRLAEKASRFAHIIRLGLLLNGCLAATVSVYCFAPGLSRTLAGGTGCGWSDAASLALIVLATVVVFVSLGNVLPRRLASREPEKTALGCSGAFHLLCSVLRPLAALCCGIAWPLLRMCGVNPSADTDAVTEEDIRQLMDAGEETGTIEGAQKDMVYNVFEFDDITAAEIMTPRTDVTAVEADDPVSEALKRGVEDGYSRLPVYEDDIDHIIGILYIKDLLPYVGQTVPPDVTIRSLLRDTHFVPDTKKCDDLFEEMNQKHLQMAIVVDEYGGVAGIVTMEDLLESIVGNMQDEFDDEDEEVTRLDDHSFVVDGTLNIGELDELLGTELPEGDYDTVAGFLMDQLGHIPEENENAVVTFGTVTFTIQRMDDRRIEQVLVHIDTPAGDGTDKIETE